MNSNTTNYILNNSQNLQSYQLIKSGKMSGQLLSQTLGDNLKTHITLYPNNSLYNNNKHIENLSNFDTSYFNSILDFGWLLESFGLGHQR
jgi:hypothetical protein